ncbi:unnamed protein product [Prorocentrum cordatum]|uniref:Uncharacterized protein n=1 Tax=Prorocentrum cordatum TaxID=2364126 RepID=A0ABN9SN04_9DINO|nr:unnamed protein product [Polarella glacialis]
MKRRRSKPLSGDKDFLAVPAIHFFGFPGFRTPSPPRLPPRLFENANRGAPRGQPAGPRGEHRGGGGAGPCLCDCMPRGDPQAADVQVCQQEHPSEEVTIRASPARGDAAAGAGAEPAGGGGGGLAGGAPRGHGLRAAAPLAAKRGRGDGSGAALGGPEQGPASHMGL